MDEGVSVERTGQFSCCFVVTGSNARLHSGELSGVLTGRHLTGELFPFDLAEFRRLRPRGTLVGRRCGCCRRTVASYIAAGEAAYLLYSVPYFAFSDRRRRRHW